MWCLFISFISFWTLILKKNNNNLPYLEIHFIPVFNKKTKEVRGADCLPEWMTWRAVATISSFCCCSCCPSPFQPLSLYSSSSSCFVLTDQPRNIFPFLLKALLFGFLESSELLLFSSLSHDTFASTWAYFSFHSIPSLNFLLAKSNLRTVEEHSIASFGFDQNEKTIVVRLFGYCPPYSWLFD